MMSAMSPRRFSAFALLALCLSPCAFAGNKSLTPTDQAVLTQLGLPPRPEKHKNYEEAPGWRKKELETAAKSGNAQAEWAWGIFWIDEHWHQNPITMGVSYDEPDQKKATEWLHKAQAGGYVHPLEAARAAQFFLVEGNRAEARFWLEQGALAGNVNCTHALIALVSAEPPSPQRDQQLARWNAKASEDNTAWTTRQQQLNNEATQRNLKEYDYVNNGVAQRNAAHDARVQAFSGAVNTASQAVNVYAQSQGIAPGTTINDTLNQNLNNINNTAANIQQQKQQASATKTTTPSLPRPGLNAGNSTATSSTQTIATNGGIAVPGDNKPSQALRGQGCTSVATLVTVTTKHPTGPSNCGGEIVAYFTNHANVTVDCPYVFHRNGVWSDASGVRLNPGQTIGGEMQGTWTCGVDRSDVRYACYEHGATDTSGNVCDDIAHFTSDGTIKFTW